MNNKSANSLVIDRDRTSGVKYIAESMPNGNGIAVKRSYNNKTAVVATFIDCEEYVSTAVRVESNCISLMNRTPSTEYVSSMPLDMQARFDDKDSRYIVSLKTKSGNIMRVHLSDPDMIHDVFRRLVVTLDDGYAENTAAHILVEDDNEITVTAFGYPAGYEIE